MTDQLALWGGIAIDAALVILGAMLADQRSRGRADAHTEALDTAIAEERAARQAALELERREREKADAETRAIADTASKNAAMLHDRMLGEINDELRRMRHDLHEMRAQNLNLIEQTARADGRREVFEQLVQKMLERNAGS